MIILLFMTETIHAETTYVNDCLDENPDCFEELNTTLDPDAESNGDNSFVTMETGSLGMSIIKTVFSLILILALIYFGLKFFNQRNKYSSTAKSLENLGGIPVGQNKSIQIIRVGQKLYLIGVGDNVELLQEITDEEVINELMTKERDQSLEQSSPWQSFISRTKGKQTEQKTNDQFLNLLTKELDKLKKNRQEIKASFGQKEDSK